jgi:signal transduction histidine kinase
MHNLITNAVEAMQSLPADSRRLTISTHEFGGTLLVSVEDTGSGVSDDQQSQIFQAFYSTKATGMGMGLAICSSILAAHGGTLRAVHGRQEESLFLFTLPRC